MTPETLDLARPFLVRCLDDAIESWLRFDATDLQRAELRESLLRDLEGFVTDEAGSELELVPRRFEVSFGMERAAPELQRGLPLAEDIFLSGKIDRIDQDPFGARGIVQDYKSGRTAHSAAEIDRELKLQVPLYMLVLRDLVGVEPLGGVYRALSGKRPTPRDAARERQGRPAGLRGQRLPRRGGVLEPGRGGAGAGGRRGRADPRRRRPPRSQGRRLPELVRRLVDLPDRARMKAWGT